MSRLRPERIALDRSAILTPSTFNPTVFFFFPCQIRIFELGVMPYGPFVVQYPCHAFINNAVLILTGATFDTLFLWCSHSPRGAID